MPAAKHRADIDVAYTAKPLWESCLEFMAQGSVDAAFQREHEENPGELAIHEAGLVIGAQLVNRMLDRTLLRCSQWRILCNAAHPSCHLVCQEVGGNGTFDAGAEKA